MQHEFRVAVRVQSAPDHIEVEYAFENPFAEPVLVFDRMWNMKTDALDPNWAYVDIQSPNASVKRQLELLPRGLHHENPTVPYGREIAPSTRSTGKILLPIPIKQHGEYDAYLRRGANFQPVPLHQLTFSLAWCPKPTQLPPELQPVEMNGERLWLLPYTQVANIQRIATAAPAQINATGEALR